MPDIAGKNILIAMPKVFLCIIEYEFNQLNVFTFQVVFRSASFKAFQRRKDKS